MARFPAAPPTAPVAWTAAVVPAASAATTTGQRGQRGSDRGGDEGDHPRGADDEANPQERATAGRVAETAEQGPQADHHRQHHRQEEGREHAPENHPSDWIAMHAATRRVTLRAATPPKRQIVHTPGGSSQEIVSSGIGRPCAMVSANIGGV